MVKHTQTNSSSVYDHFAGLALKGLSRSVTRETNRKQCFFVVNRTYTKILNCFLFLWLRLSETFFFLFAYLIMIQVSENVNIFT